ncbi:MAG: hydroxyisourate hydrolase [Paraglaciecola sp.]|uniref:hydroxyisourate hydrolase n=1 Tax=Pseudomonadati TaxID=3379134 RepID=UPI00273CFD7D|nr:hydroxyisourate hydrolase [Paraglaciecola sp.]MDP5031615.1 hydroxyisourate hydrolase [Paraglaciecola sp.]MDP5041153.1 hydroxyisourate hydrolase [Paraglaciecola sp.]MDP5131266.1 hydroxyisourate hydrolase [Paraglaciecola sp.]
MSISLSSHVLDTTLGKPAANMKLTLITPEGREVEALTNNDGRCNQWQATEFTAGIYQLRFHTKSYLLEHHAAAFYPYVDIHFELVEDGGHYHVPLLISPFGFSSYRGS